MVYVIARRDFSRKLGMIILIYLKNPDVAIYAKLVYLHFNLLNYLKIVNDMMT